MLLVTKQGNLTKEKAFTRGMKNIFPDHTYKLLCMSHEFDVRPLTREKTKSAAVENVRRLCSQMRGEGFPGNSIAIAIQKGTTLLDLEEKPLFISAIAVGSVDETIEFSFFHFEEVTVPEKARELALAQVEPYEIWEQVLGDPFKKGIGPYQCLTSKDETVWLQQLFEASFHKLKTLMENPSV